MQQRRQNNLMRWRALPTRRRGTPSSKPLLGCPSQRSHRHFSTSQQGGARPKLRRRPLRTSTQELVRLTQVRAQPGRGIWHLAPTKRPPCLSPLMRNRSVTCTRWGEVNIPVRRPYPCRRMLSVNAQVEPFPLRMRADSK